MDKKQWETKRKKDIKNGSYQYSSLTPIKLALSVDEIKKEVKEYKGEYTDRYGFNNLIMNLKSRIYLKRCNNTKKELIEAIYNDYINKREQFPKLFWEEYIFQYEPRYMHKDKDTYKSLLDNATKMVTLWEFLEDHKEHHGCTGNIYQNSELYGIVQSITGKSYSMRAWGALMSAYMNSKKGKRKYHYMDFYM